MEIKTFALSDKGPVRKKNEDSYLIIDLNHPNSICLNTFPDEECTFNSRNRGLLLAVADGVGGGVKGDVASRLCLENLAKHISSLSEDLSVEERISEFEGGFYEAQEKLCEIIKEDSSLEGMATILTAAWIVDQIGIIGHLGDSRAYLFRGGTVFQTTTDHTPGSIYSQQGGSEGKSSVILQWLGGDKTDIVVEISVAQLHAGDRIILCTDGLWQEVPDHVLRDSIISGMSAKAVSKSLVENALDRGTDDNLTVIIAEMSGKMPLTQIPSVTNTLQRVQTAEYDLDSGKMRSWRVPLDNTFVDNRAERKQRQPSDPKTTKGAEKTLISYVVTTIGLILLLATIIGQLVILASLFSKSSPLDSNSKDISEVSKVQLPLEREDMHA